LGRDAGGKERNFIRRRVSRTKKTSEGRGKRRYKPSWGGESRRIATTCLVFEKRLPRVVRVGDAKGFGEGGMRTERKKGKKRAQNCRTLEEAY